MLKGDDFDFIDSPMDAVASARDSESAGRAVASSANADDEFVCLFVAVLVLDAFLGLCLAQCPSGTICMGGIFKCQLKMHRGTGEIERRWVNGDGPACGRDVVRVEPS